MNKLLWIIIVHYSSIVLDSTILIWKKDNYTTTIKVLVIARYPFIDRYAIRKSLNKNPISVWQFYPCVGVRCQTAISFMVVHWKQVTCRLLTSTSGTQEKIKSISAHYEKKNNLAPWLVWVDTVKNLGYVSRVIKFYVRTSRPISLPHSTFNKHRGQGFNRNVVMSILVRPR